MKEVQLERLKTQIPEREFEILHAANPWFRLSHSAGYAKGLWNFTVALMDAECESLELAYQIADESKDLTHLCGFHKLRFALSRWEQMRWFLTRVWHDKAILKLKPPLKDYIEFICENSRVRWGTTTRPMGLLVVDNDGDRAFQRLPWRTKEWYKAHRPKRKPAARVVPLSEFWPYIGSNANDDHDLLIAVDRVIPRHVPEQMRADICQDVLVSILTGDITLDNLRDGWSSYMRKAYKTSPSKYGHLSLDAPIFSDSTLTLAETII
jgi:hypothetical protein